MSVIQLLGGGGALVIALWIWRLQRVAGMIRALALSFALIGALSVSGVLDVEVHPEVALDLLVMIYNVALDLLGVIGL